MKDILNTNILKEGSVILVIHNSYLIEGYENDNNQKVNKSLIKIRAAMQNKMILQGEIVGIQEFPMKRKNEEKENLYSAIVDFEGLTGYIELDEMSIHSMTVNRLRDRIGTLVRFMVTRFVPETEDSEAFFIASRKQAQSIAADTTIGLRKEGEITKATVIHVGGNYITVDLGGIESDIPISETAHGWVDILSDRFKVGDIIDVKILTMDKEKQRFTLSHKATLPDPWKTAARKLKVNAEYKCKVSGVTESGVFISLAEGVDAYAPHLRFAMVNKGDTVLARIINMNVEKRELVCRIIRVIG